MSGKYRIQSKQDACHCIYSILTGVKLEPLTNAPLKLQKIFPVFIFETADVTVTATLS